MLDLTGRNAPTVAVLEAMIAPIRHRGPDGMSTWSDGAIGLAHQRLAIIDPVGGAQPIANEDGQIRVVFNGEIFNYRELRDRLEKRGHRFRTDTDTEVLVHLYEDMGESFVDELNGQFAVALWDARRRSLILARDRVGILPLFVHEGEGCVVFGSEIKSLLPVMRGGAELDPQGLDQLLTFWAPVAPRTMFRGVEEIPPGEVWRVDGGGVIHRRRYWEHPFPEPGEGFHDASIEDLAEELVDILTDATRLRLHADVPVGAYLSGGLDSSIIAALASNMHSTTLRTFGIGFADDRYDESAYQREMAAALGTGHTGFTCTSTDIVNGLHDAVHHAEAPLVRTAPVPMAQLASRVREQGFKVVLTGEGADEVLGGYDIFKEAKIRRFWSRNPDSTWRPRLLQRLYPYLDLEQARNRHFVEAFFGQGIDRPESLSFSHLTRWMNTAHVKEFFAPGMRQALTESPEDALAETLPDGFGGWHWFNRAQYLELRTLMSGYLLSSQGDRMLMSASVEGRFPFLDHRLMEFAARLHPRFKMRALNEKYLLKRAMASRLPERIRRRTKQPYRAPDVAAFVDGEGRLPEYVEDLMGADAIREAGYFEPDRVTRLLHKVRAGRATGFRDNLAFVAILTTQIWHDCFVGRGVRMPVAAHAQAIR